MGIGWQTLVATGALCAAIVGFSGASRAETLGEALTSAYTESGLIEQNRAVLRAADEDVAQAVSSLRPVLSWQANLTREYGYAGRFDLTGAFTEGGSIDQSGSIQLLAEIVLYAGGANRLGVDSAKEAVLATRQGLVAAEQQVLLRAVQAFMGVRRAVETVALRENNVRVIGQELRAAQDRFEVGEVTRTDVALAEARLAGARSALAGAQGDLAVATEEYRAAVGRAPGALVQPAALPTLPGDVDAAKAIAVRNHPDILRAQHEVMVAELGVQIAEAALRPRVSLQGSYGATESFDDQTYSRGGSISLGARQTIYQGGQLSSLVRRARSGRDQARANLHVVRLGIEQSVGQAYAQLRVARATLKAVASQVRAASVAFDGVREEATLGARTTLDVLDAEQELLDARAQQVSAQVDETIAAYTVLASVGRLTAAGLQLPVTQYDPAAYYNLVQSAPAGLSRQGRELDRVLEAIGKR